ncbi:hypothetical protein [Fibrella aquatica]|uniref:hypothetical protein n=1 Tax=Fibrella aquatica TaxID=3242487 RepID=UPI0035229328
MNRSHGFSLLLLISFCIWSCKEKVIDVPAPLPDPGLTWQVNEDFLFDRKIQLNSYADSSKIMLAGSQTTAIAPGQSRPGPDTIFVHYGGQAQPNGRTDYRPLLHPSFIGFIVNDFVNLIPTASPVQSYVNLVVRLPALDPDFASFDVLPAAIGETMVANDQNQVIVPYRRYDRSYNTPVIDGRLTNIALISVDVPRAPNVQLKTADTKLISFPGGNFLQAVSSIGSYFLVSTSNGTYRISPDGSYQKTYPYSFQNLFTFKGTVYGITAANTSTLKLAASTDQGNTWSIIVDQLPNEYRFLTYKTVGDQLIATYNGQLFQLIITPTTLSVVELDNTGLYGNKITSVAQFRNTVYVSTLSGVFTKPVRTFLTQKK